MKKSELFKVLTEEIGKVLAEARVGEKVVNSVNGILETYVAPKKGGQAIDLEKVVRRDEKGNITHILDVSGVAFLPATLENFYEAKTGGITVKIGDKEVALKRLSRVSEKIRKDHEKVTKASIKAITDDVLEGKIKPEEGKAKIEKIKNTQIDFSPLLKVEGAIKA